MTDNEHLERSSFCRCCHWIGISGELVFKDKLRCPECDSATVSVGDSLSPVERLDNLKAAFVENDIPWPTQH